MRQLGFPLKTRLSLLAALITCAVVVLAAPPAQADTVTTVAGGGTALGDGGTATAAELSNPTAIATTADGGYVIADFGSGRVRKVSASGTITTLASGFSGLWGIDALADGSVLVVESDTSRIRKISATGTVTTVAGNGGFGFSGDGGPATAATLRGPSAVSALPGGGFLIADMGNHRIREVDSAGIISTVAGNGTAGLGSPATRGDGGPAISAEIRSPRGVDATADGGFLVTGEDLLVRRVNAAGIISTVAGGGTDTSFDGGPATAAALNVSAGIEAEADGSFVFAEQFSRHRVHRVRNGVIRTVAGTGTFGVAGEGAEATTAGLGSPIDVALVPDGYLIAEAVNNRILKVTLTDADGDSIYDRDDNCPNDPNPYQDDLDGDGEGNACDSDVDGDGVANGDDPFPDDPTESADADGDGTGDNADAFDNDPTETADTDSDGKGDNSDNCRTDANSDQADLDEDGRGDACDADIDGDGVDNGDDWAPRDAGESRDTDGDGVGDNADAFPADPTETTDGDGDGVGDNGDNCPTDANPGQADLDGDRQGDACDADVDGDGVDNADDWAPRDATESRDSDGDGVGDNGDAFPNNPAETEDTDLDGVGDNGDNCRTDANEGQEDLDNDGRGDACDADIDGDGVPNGEDAFPRDRGESSDRDGDGIGDNGDRFPEDPNESADADDDGIGDGADNCREQSNADQADQDGDGTGDVCDSDLDGDSVANDADNCATKANEDQADRDEDGTGDECDSTPRPTAASICGLLTDYVVSSPKYASLSSTKQAALRESLGNICTSIEKISGRLNPQQKAVLVRLQRLSVRTFAHDWLTADQAAKLDRLIGNM